jgi:hypothetical protein
MPKPLTYEEGLRDGFLLGQRELLARLKDLHEERYSGNGIVVDVYDDFDPDGFAHEKGLPTSTKRRLRRWRESQKKT